MPKNETINSKFKNNHFRYTNINIDDLVCKMTKNGFICKKSDNAGMYVCNYIYYKSLEVFQEKKNVFSLFLHVGKFEDLSKETQEIFIWNMINEFFGVKEKEKKNGKENLKKNIMENDKEINEHDLNLI